MEQAARFFRLQLRAGAGTAARDYLAGRRLAELRNFLDHLVRPTRRVRGRG